MPAVSGYNAIEDGLSQMHNLIYQQRLMFVEEVEPLGFRAYSGKDLWSEAMAYRRQTAKDGTVLQSIEPGQFDHATDALRYALARKKPA
jgi:hypothetical protein